MRIKPSYGSGFALKQGRIFAEGFFKHFQIKLLGKYSAEYSAEENVLYINVDRNRLQSKLSYIDPNVVLSLETDLNEHDPSPVSLDQIRNDLDLGKPPGSVVWDSASVISPPDTSSAKIESSDLSQFLAGGIHAVPDRIKRRRRFYCRAIQA